MRFSYLRPTRLPHLPAKIDASTTPQYLQQLAVALEEWYRMDLRAIRELDNGPVFVAQLGTNQSITAGVMTTVELTSAIDTHGWWDAVAFNYTPKEPGFYRVAWNVNLHDSGAIATSTYGYGQVGAYQALTVGNGAANDVAVAGATIFECDGSSTALKLEAELSAGSAPLVSGAAYRTWLSIDYLGRRALGT